MTRLAGVAVLAASFIAMPALLSSGTASAGSVGDPLRGTNDVIVDGPPPPKIYAKSWVVVDADTGDVLAAKSAHRRLKPASTLKSLTAITLLPRLNLSDEYRARWQDAHVVGSAVGIVPGSEYTIDELFYGLMLPSGNDAARALATANGSVAVTVRQMNKRAQSLGALDTHAVNPTGLDAPEQETSAFDLALFAREGLRDKDFRRYVTTTSYAFPAQEPKGNSKRKSFMIYNQNPLLMDGYRGILGVKTGYTTEAGRTYLAAAERGGQRLIVAAMGIIESSETAASKLFEWGWNHGESVTPVGSLDEPRQGVAGVEATPTASTTTPGASSTLADPDSAGAEQDEAQATGTGPGLLVWVLGGAVLIGFGWWLQSRRRPR